MSNLNTNKRVGKIIEICKSNDITAYEIEKHTGLNQAGVQRILNGEVKKPREATLKKIENFLDNFIFKKMSPMVSEDKEYYKRELSMEERIAEQVAGHLEPYFEDLKRFINNKINNAK